MLGGGADGEPQQEEDTLPVSPKPEPQAPERGQTLSGGTPTAAKAQQSSVGDSERAQRHPCSLHILVFICLFPFSKVKSFYISAKWSLHFLYDTSQGAERSARPPPTYRRKRRREGMGEETVGGRGREEVERKNGREEKRKEKIRNERGEEQMEGGKEKGKEK